MRVRRDRTRRHGPGQRAFRSLQRARRQARHARTPPPPALKPATLAIRVDCTGNVTEEALAQIEALLATRTEAVDLRFARACLLEELGRLTLARGAYKGVLARDATHFGALMNLGTMLYLENRRPEARILYQHATQHHPREASAFVNLGNVLAEDNPAAARAAYERALELDPQHATGNFASRCCSKPKAIPAPHRPTGGGVRPTDRAGRAVSRHRRAAAAAGVAGGERRQHRDHAAARRPDVEATIARRR